jgi:hypothetical protein
MNIVVNKDIGAVVDLVRIGAASSVTAGGAGDNTAVVGVWIDRANFAAGQGYAGGSPPMSALIEIAYTATLGAGKALAFALLVEDSADGVTPATLQTIPSAQAALSAGGGTVTGSFGWHVNLGSARRYVRFSWTPDLNNTATDTASIFPMCVLGGFDRLPSPN